MADKQRDTEKPPGAQQQRTTIRQRLKAHAMGPKGFASIGKELAYAVADIRQKVVEEATYGRVVTPRPMSPQDKMEPGGIHGPAVSKDQSEPGGIHGKAPSKEGPATGGIHGAAAPETSSSFRERCQARGRDLERDRSPLGREQTMAPER